MGNSRVTSRWSAVSRPAGTFVVGIFCAFALTGAASDPKGKTAVPDLSGPWMRDAGTFDFAPPLPETGPGPLVNISGDREVPVANYDSPLLKPWAAAEVKKHGDILLSGKIAPDAHASCNPMGVPFVLQVRENVRFLQTSDWVMMTYQNDNQRRLVRLNAQHSAHPAPTWFGESIGRYEGDTLVIDTIGIAIHEMSAIDRFGTPHTEALHVVERYRVADDRKTMRVDFTVDDPGTFNMPWHASVVYGQGTEMPVEHVCQENYRIGAGGLATIPTAAKADF
jgi:hypothetical protein